MVHVGNMENRWKLYKANIEKFKLTTSCVTSSSHKPELGLRTSKCNKLGNKNLPKFRGLLFALRTIGADMVSKPSEIVDSLSNSTLIDIHVPK